MGSVNAPSGPEDSEPFLQKVCWEYILRVIGWARKYGIRVNLDLHAVPGSQNGEWFGIDEDGERLMWVGVGYNHSGKLGSLNFMSGIMGYANAQRTLDYIRTITEFISQVSNLLRRVDGSRCMHAFVLRRSSTFYDHKYQP